MSFYLNRAAEKWILQSKSFYDETFWRRSSQNNGLQFSRKSFKIFFYNKTHRSFWKGFYFILDLTFCGDFWIENFLLIELDHVSLIMLKHISGHYKQKTWNQTWDGTGHLSHKLCPDPAYYSEFQRCLVPKSVSRDTNIYQVGQLGEPEKFQRRDYHLIPHF